jgi:hypothetical protein
LANLLHHHTELLQTHLSPLKVVSILEQPQRPLQALLLVLHQQRHLMVQPQRLVALVLVDLSKPRQLLVPCPKHLNNNSKVTCLT